VEDTESTYAVIPRLRASFRMDQSSTKLTDVTPDDVSPNGAFGNVAVTGMTSSG
jgi:hypothetical protein